jgi:hypothetical protein
MVAGDSVEDAIDKLSTILDTLLSAFSPSGFVCWCSGDSCVNFLLPSIDSIEILEVESAAEYKQSRDLGISRYVARFLLEGS